MKINFEKTIVVVGHYGSGKTEFALNLAFKLKDEGKSVTIVDLDIVNPYFRTNDLKKELLEAGIEVIAPLYASTNVDVPSLPAQVYSAFEKEGYVIFDVGGDDDGAIALGRYHEYFIKKPYDMLGVINTRRPLTSTAEEIAVGLSEIKQASRLEFTGIVSNTNLSVESTAEIAMEGFEITKTASEMLGINIRCISVLKDIAHDIEINKELLFPIEAKLKKW